MVIEVAGKTVLVTATDYGKTHMDVDGETHRTWELVATCGDFELYRTNTVMGHWLRDYWSAKYPNSTIKYHRND